MSKEEKPEKKYNTFHEKAGKQSRIISRNNFTYRHIINLIDKYGIDKESVLDIGCGVGTLCFYLAGKGKHVLGIDVSSKAIAACKESSKRLALSELTRFEILDFSKEGAIRGKFDLVILTEVIEHLPDDRLALKKIFQLLNKGGVAIITTPSLNAPLYRLGYADSFDRRVGHLRRYTVDNLAKKCEECGFTVIETKKTEGILRNFLFLNSFAGKFVRFIKFYISDMVTFIDRLTIPVFGESNLVVVVKKS